MLLVPRAPAIVAGAAPPPRRPPAPAGLAAADAAAPAPTLALEAEPAEAGDDLLDGVDDKGIAALARAPGAGAAQVTRLSNGLTLIALRKPGFPVTSMVLGFHAEPQPGEPRGARVAALFGRRYHMQVGPLDRDILQSFRRDTDSYQEELSMFSSGTEGALDLLSSEATTLYVGLPAPELDRWIERAALAEKTPDQQAERAFQSALWGGHIYGTLPEPDEVRRATADEARGWLDRVRRPGNGALAVVGDIDPAVVAREAERQLESWRSATRRRCRPRPRRGQRARARRWRC
jgi:predicted Zn-dependent peptidase